MGWGPRSLGSRTAYLNPASILARQMGTPSWEVWGPQTHRGEALRRRRAPPWEGPQLHSSPPTPLGEQPDKASLESLSAFPVSFSLYLKYVFSDRSHNKLKNGPKKAFSLKISREHDL